MVTTLKPFRIAFLFLLFSITFLTAEWMIRTKKKVATGNILQKIKELSVTSCSLTCKRDRKCKSFGTKKDLKLGGVGTCYLLSSDTDAGQQGGLVTSFFVTKVEDDNKPSDSELIPPRGNWTLQASNLCFGNKNSDYGTFLSSHTGKLCGIRLEHLNGKVWCTATTSSYWGCPYVNNNNGKDFRNRLMILITDISDKIIYPKVELVEKFLWGYQVTGYDENSKDVELQFQNGAYYDVNNGEELRVWYAEDFYNGKEDNNKDTKTCARVYAKFNC